MKFATWNLFIGNDQQTSAIDFLLNEDIDVACFQELRFETTKYLNDSNLRHLNYCVSHHQNGRGVFLAIASNLKPIHSETVIINNVHNTVLSRICGLNYQKIAFLYNDYLVNGRNLRVFGVHLPFGSSPSRHLSLLEEIFRKLNNDINVICGDFNSFGHFPWNLLLGPINGSRWTDCWKNEIESIKELLKRFNLKLDSDKSTTYPLCGTSIDHIIIPDSWSSYQYKTYKKCCGSDHKLVVLEENVIS